MLFLEKLKLLGRHLQLEGVTLECFLGQKQKSWGVLQRFLRLWMLRNFRLVQKSSKLIVTSIYLDLYKTHLCG